MPKIIDHDAQRKQLATRAAALFSKHGYAGLGMRKIAEELGLSKSALYHYFPSKKALFHACTEVVMSFDAPMGEGAIPLETLFEILKTQAPGFADELSLVLDFTRGLTPEQIRQDPTMQLANARYTDLVHAAVPQKDVGPVVCLLLGALMMRHFDGGETDLDEIMKWLIPKL